VALAEVTWLASAEVARRVWVEITMAMEDVVSAAITTTAAVRITRHTTGPTAAPTEWRSDSEVAGAWLWKSWGFTWRTGERGTLARSGESPSHLTSFPPTSHIRGPTKSDGLAPAAGAGPVLWTQARRACAPGRRLRMPFGHDLCCPRSPPSTVVAAQPFVLSRRQDPRLPSGHHPSAEKQADRRQDRHLRLQGARSAAARSSSLLAGPSGLRLYRGSLR
jgi:hypothetical protein